MCSRPQDDQRYRLAQLKKEKEWESLCIHCGACCGLAEGDPCEHLLIREDKSTYCAVYGSRFGKHRTVSGRSMRCVPIRKILHQRWPGDNRCGYKTGCGKSYFPDGILTGGRISPKIKS